MLDENFKLYLIEVNTNPALDTSSPVTSRLIPTMFDNLLKIVLDPLFEPKEPLKATENKFELIFDELLEDLTKESDDDEALEPTKKVRKSKYFISSQW